MRTPSARLRVIGLVVAVAGLFALAAHGVPHSPAALRAAIAPYGGLAPLAFVAAWALLTPALFSGTLLAGASGLLFGPALGTPVSLAGATLGAALSFTIARRCGGDAATRLGGERVQKLRERLESSAFRSVVMLRLAPGVPSTVLNYAAGLTRIRLRTFAAASAVGGAPRIFAYTALGGSLAHAGSPLGIVALSLIAGLGVAGVLVALRTRLRRPAPALAPSEL